MSFIYWYLFTKFREILSKSPVFCIFFSLSGLGRRRDQNETYQLDETCENKNQLFWLCDCGDKIPII